MKIELCEPVMGKGWSLQITAEPELPEGVRDSVLLMMQTPVVKRAKPFLQGDQPSWLMVEFWTDNEDAIITAAAVIANTITQ